MRGVGSLPPLRDVNTMPDRVVKGPRPSTAGWHLRHSLWLIAVFVASAIVASIPGPGSVVALGPAPSPSAVSSAAVGVVLSPSSTAPPDDEVAMETDSSPLLSVGHLFRFTGTIVGVGALVALLWVVRSDKADLRVVLGVARMLGLVIATGAALEWAAHQQTSGVGLSGLVTTGRGWAALLSMTGGILITFGVTEHRSLTPIGSTFRWSPGRSSAVGLVGAVAAIVSFGFDGHRPELGPQPVAIAIDLVHVANATLWGGAVCVLALVSLLQIRSGRATGLTASVVRLSSIAPWSLGALVISGVALTVLLADADVGAVSSPWGRTLLVKLILVGIAILVGIYNRVALLPRVRNDDLDDVAVGQLRVVLAAQGAFILAATLVTVALVQLVP